MMKTANEIAREAFKKIDSATSQVRFQITYDRFKGYKIGRADTAQAEQLRKRSPQSVVGTYDWNATVQQIADDLIAVGCPA